MLLWGLNLGYPINQLQHMRWTFLGYLIPIYYFFTVLPMIGAAALALAFKRNWTKWELIWWMLPLICLPGILHSGNPIWSSRQWLSWIVRGIIPGGIIFLVAHREVKVLLLHWVYPVIIAAALLGLAELYYDHNPFWANSLNRQVGIEALTIPIPQTSQLDNPFYQPPDSLLLSSRPWGTQGNRIPYASTIVAFLPLGLWLLKYKKRFYLALIHLSAIITLFSILLLAQVHRVG